VLFLLLSLVAPLVGASERVPERFENRFGMSLVLVPAGTFQMGTADLDAALFEMPQPDVSKIRDETPAHRVRISRPFYLGETEVTQKQWLAVMQNRPGPEAHWRRPDWEGLPVLGVSWRMARRFVEELNRLDPGHGYRLPSEAEWEYAARAGRPGLRPWDTERLGDYAWFIDNSGDQPQPVATREPNEFALYDMLGNAWEWTADRYAADTYTQEPRQDPQGPSEGRSRVRRGGSYHCPLHLTRPGYRAADSPDARYSVLGLRVAAEASR
jgi:formylglycine-generating enzyme required for sulfatase activity